MRGLLGILLLALFCTPQDLAAVTYQVAEAHLDDDGVQRLELVADSYFFRPNYLVVKSGIPVELEIRRGSWLVPHDFVLKIPEWGIDISKSIDTDGTRIRFTPTQPGTFPFFCSEQLLFFESHRDKGMEGVLEVRP